MSFRGKAGFDLENKWMNIYILYIYMQTYRVGRSFQLLPDSMSQVLQWNKLHDVRSLGEVKGIQKHHATGRR